MKTSLIDVAGQNGRTAFRTITPMHPDSLGSSLTLLGGNSTSSTYGTANRCVFVPFTLDRAATLTGAFLLNGGTATGHFDIGVYLLGADGSTITSIATLGSTAQSGTSVIQKAAMAATLNRGAYFMGFSADSASLTLSRYQPQPRQLRNYILLEKLSTFPLPTGSISTTTLTDGTIPVFGLYLASTM